jgi:hypothetical protein
LKSGTNERPIKRISTLAGAISHYGHQAYLLTVAQDGPHTGHVTIELRGGCIGQAPGPTTATGLVRTTAVAWRGDTS